MNELTEYEIRDIIHNRINIENEIDGNEIYFGEDIMEYGDIQDSEDKYIYFIDIDKIIEIPS